MKAMELYDYELAGNKTEEGQAALDRIKKDKDKAAKAMGGLAGFFGGKKEE